MTREEMTGKMLEMVMPETWRDPKLTMIGRNFKACFRGRVEIMAGERRGEIYIHTEAGPMWIEDQILSVTQGEA